jgi:hypothetical protein
VGNYQSQAESDLPLLARSRASEGKGEKRAIGFIKSSEAAKGSRAIATRWQNSTIPKGNRTRVSEYNSASLRPLGHGATFNYLLVLKIGITTPIKKSLPTLPLVSIHNQV